MSNHESSLQPKIQRFENLKNKRTEVVKNIIVVKQIQYNFYDRKIRHYICRLTYYKNADQQKIQLKHFLQHNNIYLLIAKLMKQSISCCYNQRR